MDALDDPSISDISIQSHADEDYLNDQLRKRTYALMDKKITDFQKAENIIRDYKKPIIKRSVKPKLIFNRVRVKTSGTQWRGDRQHMITTNPAYYKQEVSQIEKDKQMLLKRRQGTVMKNLALQQDLEITKKKIDKDLRRKIWE